MGKKVKNCWNCASFLRRTCECFYDVVNPWLVKNPYEMTECPNWHEVIEKKTLTCGDCYYFCQHCGACSSKRSCMVFRNADSSSCNAFVSREIVKEKEKQGLKI